MVRVEMFDEEHEKDLEYAVNEFLEALNDDELIDIKYNIHAFLSAANEQIYCYTAMVVYRINK